MRPFKYTNAKDASSAVKLLKVNPDAKFLAGGTNLLDLMKEDVERPNELIDITRLSLTQIKPVSVGTNQGGLSIGSLGKNTDAANHPLIRQNYPLLTQAMTPEELGRLESELMLGPDQYAVGWVGLDIEPGEMFAAEVYAPGK